MTSALTRIPDRAPRGRGLGCYVLQVDGETFTKTMAFGAIFYP